MRTTERKIKMLIQEGGRCPFEEWFNAIRDVKTSAAIDARLARVEAGLLGVHENVGGGVWEIKIDFGPGYRVYYAEYDQVIVVLLGGGTKKKQQQDIDKAQALWGKYRHDAERLQRDLRAPDA